MKQESNVFDFSENVLRNKKKCNIIERKKPDLFTFYTSELKSNTTSVNFKTLTKNLFVTGSVGTGKTKSVLLPIFENLMEDNVCGIFFDAKGLIKNDILEIVHRKNRDDDLIFVGVGDNCKKINLLYNLSANEVIDFFKRKFSYLLQDKKNAVWFNWGFNDILQMLLLYEEYYSIVYNGEKPFFSIELINKLSTESDFVNHIINFLRENYFCLSYNGKKVFKNINSEVFSIYSSLKADALIESKIQYGYRTISALSLINSIPKKIKNAFYSDCFSNNDYFDIGQLIFNENKVVVFSGNPEFVNEISIELKLIKQKFYSSKINNFSNIKSFLIIDEYQLFISTENNNTGMVSELNDNDWLSISREFNHCNIFSTQSVNSLISSTSNVKSIYSILQNFVNKICFKTSDLATISVLFPIINDGLFLMKLNLGEFVFFTEDEYCKSQTYLNSQVSYFYDIKNYNYGFSHHKNKQDEIDEFVISEYLFSYFNKKRHLFNKYHDHKLFTVNNIYADSLNIVIDLVCKNNNKSMKFFISDDFLSSYFKTYISFFDRLNLFEKNDVHFNSFSQKINSFIHMSFDYENKDFFVSKKDNILVYKIKNVNSKLFTYRGKPFLHYCLLNSMKLNSAFLKLINSEDKVGSLEEASFPLIKDDSFFIDEIDEVDEINIDSLSFFDYLKLVYDIDNTFYRKMFDEKETLFMPFKENNIFNIIFDELKEFKKNSFEKDNNKTFSFDENHNLLFKTLSKKQNTDIQKVFISKIKELNNHSINIKFFLSGKDNLPVLSVFDEFGNELFYKKISGLNVDYDYILRLFNNNSLCEKYLFNEFFNILGFKIHT